MDLVSNESYMSNSATPRGLDPNRDLNEAIDEERREMDMHKYRSLSRTYIINFLFIFMFKKKSF